MDDLYINKETGEVEGPSFDIDEVIYSQADAHQLIN